MPSDVLSSFQSQIIRVLSKLDSEKFKWDQARWSGIPNVTKHQKAKKQRECKGEEQVRNYDDDSYQEKYTVVFRQVWWLETHNLDSQKARHFQTYKYILGSRKLSSRDAAVDRVKATH